VAGRFSAAASGLTAAPVVKRVGAAEAAVRGPFDQGWIALTNSGDPQERTHHTVGSPRGGGDHATHVRAVKKRSKDLREADYG
jgi:hypothetical protein